MLRIAINGASGRMGCVLIRLIREANDLELAAAIDRSDAQVPEGIDLTESYGGGADALIDFSIPEAFRARLKECVEHKTPFVTGTTGLSKDDFAALDEAGKTIPLVQAGNFSTGISLLCKLVDEAAKVVSDYDVEILEMHHNQKIDAPSGTAKMLLGSVCEALDRDPDKDAVHGRHGEVGKRSKTEIGVHTMRGGDVFGEHTVIFAGPGERIELTHRASNREAFANGALNAARFLIGNPAGRYSLDYALGAGLDPNS